MDTKVPIYKPGTIFEFKTESSCTHRLLTAYTQTVVNNEIVVTVEFSDRIFMMDYYLLNGEPNYTPFADSGWKAVC
jgi:hypothetical protein